MLLLMIYLKVFHYIMLPGSQRAESPIDEGAELADREEFMGATATEIQHHKALSEEARKVYSDLHLDDQMEGQRGGREHRWKSSGKRKAPKISGTAELVKSKLSNHLEPL